MPWDTTTTDELDEHVKKARQAILAGEGELYCPNCQRFYVPTFASRSTAHFAGTQTDREQWDSGLCSDRCWSDYVQNSDEGDILF